MLAYNVLRPVPRYSAILVTSLRKTKRQYHAVIHELVWQCPSLRYAASSVSRTYAVGSMLLFLTATRYVDGDARLAP